MADGESNGAGAEERKPTERVILEQRAVIPVPQGVDPEKVEQAVQLLGGRRRGKTAIELAWVEVGRVTAATKTAAVEAHAGKAGTPDAKVGTFRAPTSTAWKGAIVYDAPPQPLVQRSLID